MFRNRSCTASLLPRTVTVWSLPRVLCAMMSIPSIALSGSIPAANTQTDLYPAEAFREAIQLTAGMPYSKRGGVRLEKKAVVEAAPEPAPEAAAEAQEATEPAPEAAAENTAETQTATEPAAEGGDE